MKAHRSRPVFSVWWVDASGKHHEPTASSIEAAKAKADELAQMHGLPSSTKTFSHLINDYLVTRRPDGWSDSYVNGMRDLAKAFYPIYGVACGALTQAHPEATIEAIRAAGLMPQTEIHTMRLWGRLVKHGRLWDYLAVTEEPHLWLASGSKFAPGQRHVAGKYTEVTCKEFVWDDFTKPGTVRTTAYHRALANRLEACFAELESESDLMFPDPRFGAPMCRHDYLKMIFIPAGLAVGWAVAGRKKGRPNKHGVVTTPGAVSSLVWHPHSFRHVACTSMATTRLADPERWYEGWSMSAYEISLAVDDRPEPGSTV